MIKTPRIISVFLLATLILSACNLPTNNQGSVAETAAAQTVAAQLTAIVPITATIPVVVPVTNTPITALPTAIPSATSLPPATAICDGAQFIADVTVPDDTVFTPNQTFTKTWRLKNTGTCSWTPSYSVAFSDGNSMNGPATQALSGNVNPGQTIDISVNLTAPAAPGNYTGNYRLRNAAGVLFSKFYVQIKVKAPTPPTSTSTLPPAIVFAVTSVTYTVSTWNSPGFVNCPQIIANVTVNAAGTVNYHWIRSDGPSGSGTLTFATAGTQSTPAEQWALGSVWAPPPPEWMGVYVDSPNHHDFGHATMPACTTP